jgi:DNA-binding CsgD family transcriptional regulator
MSGAAARLARAGPLRVFVAAADAARRDALMDSVARAGHELVASDHAADVVLAEVGRPGNGSLVVTVSGDDRDPAGLLEGDADAQQIDAALRAVAAGLVVRMPNVAEAGFRALEENDGPGLLTPREIEVLNAIGEGLTNKAIARRLGISLHTVKFHAEAIFRKLGVSTRTGAIMKASQWRQAQTLEL